MSEDPDIDLTVYYRDRLSENHSWRTLLGQGHKAKYYKLVLGLDWSVLGAAVRDKEAFFVIAGWEHPTSILLINYLAMRGSRFAVWTDTPDLSRERDPTFAFLRSTWLRWVFSRARKVMGTGRPGILGLQKMGAPEGKLMEFPFFLNLDTYGEGRRSKPTGSSPMRFVSAGRLKNDLKGHNVALQALASAHNNTGIPFEYCIAGTGPDEAILKNLAIRLDLEAFIRFFGWVEPCNLAEIYAESHVLLHPSPEHDPFPNAVLEGMAAGLAVLGSDVSGSVLDRVQNGFNGLIHRAGDSTELSEHIEYLLRNPDIAMEMGCNSRKTAATWPVELGVQAIKTMLSESNL